jgi:nucleoside-diphosphate-sugar epimerase
MRYIVFGGGGFIGSYLIQRLKKDNHYVIGVDRNIPKLLENSADEFYTCSDIGKDIPVMAENIDGVFQLCAKTASSMITDNGAADVELFTNNMKINISVLEFCIKYGIKNIFFASSACVYEDNTTNVNPQSAYGFEKYSSEHLYLYAATQYGINVKIGRIFNIYGPNQSYCMEKGRVIPSLCYKTYMSTGVVRASGNGNAQRSFLHVVDCVDAIIAVFNSSITQPINIGSDITTRIADIANMILVHSGKDALVEFASPSQSKNVRGCDNSILKTIGWSQKVSLKDGIAEVYQFIADSLKST